MIGHQLAQAAKTLSPAEAARGAAERRADTADERGHDDEGQRHQQARHQPGGEKLRDRGLGEEAVDDQVDRGRDQDAQACRPPRSRPKTGADHSSAVPPAAWRRWPRWRRSRPMTRRWPRTSWRWRYWHGSARPAASTAICRAPHRCARPRRPARGSRPAGRRAEWRSGSRRTRTTRSPAPARAAAGKAE